MLQLLQGVLHGHASTPKTCVNEGRQIKDLTGVCLKHDKRRYKTVKALSKIQSF